MRNFVALHPPFTVVFCYKRTRHFVMSEPPPGSISCLPLGIGNTFSCLRTIRDQMTRGTPQWGGEGELAASLSSSCSCVDGDLSRESSTGVGWD